MLPTDNAKRMLLQQHLLTSYQERQRRLSQLAANVRSLQQPSSLSAAQQPLSSLMAGFSAGRDLSSSSSSRYASSSRTTTDLNSADCSQQPSSSVLRLMLAAEQERNNNLKRRYSEIQYQQRQHQRLYQSTPQQLLGVDATNRAVARRPANEFSLPAGEMMLNNALSQKKTPYSSSLLSVAAAAPAAPPVETREESRPTKRAKVDQSEDREDSADEQRQPSASSRKDSRWMESYDQLRAYKRHNGTCTVPRGYAANPRLASWVAEQRKQYKLMMDGRQSSITQERISLLDDIGFAWNAQEAAWQRHMSDLKSFKAANGHCNCPLNDPKYPKLGLWVKEQRRHYTLMKQGKPSHMTESRTAELNSIDFCWDTHENTWMARLNDLKQFREKHGHCVCPTNYAENPKLGTWIHHQRRQYKKFKEGKPCHITAERIKALESLGFCFAPRAEKNGTEALPEHQEPEESTADLNSLDLRPSKRLSKT